jgi:uncharacterized protein YlxP (DUF503 family)
MFFALCRFDVFIPQCRSLKGKRSVLGSIKERLRARFHVSVSEVANQDLHQRGTLGVAQVGTSPAALEASLGAMRRLVEQQERCTITAWETRVEPFEGAPRAPQDQLLTLGEKPPAAADWDQIEEGDELYGPSWGREEGE